MGDHLYSLDLQTYPEKWKGLIRTQALNNQSGLEEAGAHVRPPANNRNPRGFQEIGRDD